MFFSHLFLRIQAIFISYGMKNYDGGIIVTTDDLISGRVR